MLLRRGPFLCGNKVHFILEVVRHLESLFHDQHLKFPDRREQLCRSSLARRRAGGDGGRRDVFSPGVALVGEGQNLPALPGMQGAGWIALIIGLDVSATVSLSAPHELDPAWWAWGGGLDGERGGVYTQ